MGTRHKGREWALQAIYLVDVAKIPDQRAVRSVTRLFKKEEAGKQFAEDLTMGTIKELAHLDDMIKKYAQNWDLTRMAALDRNILRLGTYEILYELDTPVSVIINEAVELAKEFSTMESGKFVNGILDRIKDERREKKD